MSARSSGFLTRMLPVALALGLVYTGASAQQTTPQSGQPSSSQSSTTTSDQSATDQSSSTSGQPQSTPTTAPQGTTTTTPPASSPDTQQGTTTTAPQGTTTTTPPASNPDTQQGTTTTTPPQGTTTTTPLAPSTDTQQGTTPTAPQTTTTTPPSAPSAGSAYPTEEQPSRADIFAGYSWLNPGATLNGVKIKSITQGFTVAGSYWVNRYFGFALESGNHFGPNADITTATFGPTIRVPLQGLSPFGLATFGVNRLTPNFGYPSRLGFGFVGGGGFDLQATRHFNIRIFEAEYEYAHQSYFPLATRRLNSQGVKLSGGLVFKIGSIGPPPPPPAMSCTASPTDVFAGEPITVTANAQNFNPKRTLTYSWTSTGGKVGGNSSTTQVDTNGLSGGSYTVSGHVTDGKKGMADCTAAFTVKQPRAPTISCAANPTTVKPGDTVTVTCQGSSPDNRNITYSYKSSAGEVSGNGPTATLNTQNAQPGTITVTGTATDDRGLSASSDASVTVEAPPPPPPPPAQASKINQIEFPDTKKPWRVDNTAKAVLDDVALRMQREPDSKLVIVGNTDPSVPAESRRASLSAERAVDTKFYLTNDKGIDPARIEVRSGGTGGKTAEMWIVPAGATYNGPGTVVDENKQKPIPDHPVPAKRKARRATTKRKTTP